MMLLSSAACVRCSLASLDHSCIRFCRLILVGEGEGLLAVSREPLQLHSASRHFEFSWVWALRAYFSIFPVPSWDILCSNPSHLSAPASDAPFNFLGLFFFLTNYTFKNIFMPKLLVFFKLWTYINAVNNHAKLKCFSVLECLPPNKLVYGL